MASPWRSVLEAAGITERFTPHGLRRTFNDMLRRAMVDPVLAKALTGHVTETLTGHVTETMRERFSTVGLDEKRLAVWSVEALRHLPERGSADNGADASTPANDTAEAQAATAAK